MKKIYIALAIMAAAALTSCRVEEPSFNGAEVGENAVVFGIRGVARSKASGASDRKVYPVQAINSRATLYLEETVEEIDGISTKGTPAYTENVGTLYGSKLGVYSPTTSFGDATYEKMDGSTVDGGWRYQHNYATSPWPDESTPVDFYFRMPTDMGGVSGIKYGTESTAAVAGKISFSYTTPATASAQQDILFGYRSASKEDYLGSLPNGIPVLLQHALTGVKFRIVNNDDKEKSGAIHSANNTETYITKVTISGIKNSGTCVFSPTGEDGGYVDITDNYSSGATGTVVWTLKDTTGTYTQAYTEAQNLTAYSAGSNPGTPASFYAASATNNLNDADASLTFWFIPQDVTDSLKIKVHFHVWDGVKNGPTDSLVLKLGEKILAQTAEQQALTKTWKAGQLRTFSLKPDKVDLEIDDELTEYVKSDVVIRNTGNVPMYVRVNMIGNWVGKLQQSSDPTDLSDETILMGHINQEIPTEGEDYQVWPWNDKDGAAGYKNQKNSNYFDEANPPKYDGTNIGYGKFVDLPEKCNAPDTTGHSNGHHWYRFDKYYYYSIPIGPGEYLAASDVLFTSYTVGKSPTFYVADAWGDRWPASNVHLEMDLAAQAIEAELDEDGKEVSNFMQAWADALGVEVADLNDL